MAFKKYGRRKCSKAFRLGFGGGETPAVSCVCGRVHFASDDPGVYDEGELEGLLEKQKADPNRYICHSGFSSVGYSHFCDIQFVYDCPCGYAGALETSIWGTRELILNFIRIRAEVELKLAETTKSKAVEAAAVLRG